MIIVYWPPCVPSTVKKMYSLNAHSWLSLVFHYTSPKLNTVCSYQLLPAIVKPSICCCSEGCECDSRHLTCVHKVFIFYKDWMFILSKLSKVWACVCWKKLQKTCNCTAVSVSSGIRGCDCVIKTCAVNQWLSVQPHPVNGWNNTKGKKIYSTSIVV